MASPYYFQFLQAVWDQLPEQDRELYSELWMAYEQTVAAVYQPQLELNLNIAVADLQAYSTERWLPYTFSSSNFVQRSAAIISTQDLSVGMNLSRRYMLKIGVDGKEPFEFNILGSKPNSTKISEIVYKINLVFGFPFASAIYDNSIIKLTSPTIGEKSSIEIYPTSVPDLNACEYVLGVDADNFVNGLPQTFPKFRFPYTLPLKRVANIPELRDFIRDDNVTVLLVNGVDYEVDSSGLINFKAVPPELMWAERTNIDREKPWYNYGFLTGIYQANSLRYVQVLQGLWFALWNGPKPDNIRIALNLLFGLPVAPVNGTISLLTPDKIEVTGSSGTVYGFDVPEGLSPDPSLVLGGSVYQFQPLVTGISVFDKINYPGFIESEIGRKGVERFLTDRASRGTGDTDETKSLTMLEEYTFLPQIQVDSFIYPDINLGNVKLFLNTFRPLNKTYLFQVIVGNFKDLLGVSGRTSLGIDFDQSATLDYNGTTYQTKTLLDDYEMNSNEGLNLDPDSMLFDDRVEVEVSISGVLADNFMA